GGSSFSNAATAAAQTLAWALAAKADFGIAPAIAASPMTWMFGCRRDSNVTGSIGHQPVLSATPASCAIAPARCGGVTFATAALYVAQSGANGRPLGPSAATFPPLARP